MKERNPVDITKYSFDEFVAFIFDREVSPRKNNKRDPWYWHVDVTFDPKTICGYYVRLFRNPTFLLERFSKSQLEEGFWAIQSEPLDCSAWHLILDSDLSLATRKECVRSMFDLFDRLFAREPLDTSVQMWWDSLCYDWHCGNRGRDRGGDDLLLQDVMFETLARILMLESEICQGAALHGLGHLHHPGTGELVDQFLKQHPNLTAPKKEYALAAARFEIQ